MKSYPLTVEALESRLVPAVWGNPWPEPEQLTLSFAPDGTWVSGRSSQLFQKLDALLPRQTWQREILRAFQTWAQHGNINLSVVNDEGQSFGFLGPLQGGGYHGDFRIASVPLAHTELAAATPFDLLGDWAGDVLLNAGYNFNVGGGQNVYDLFTVFLQEAGHVLGLPNSTDTGSAMYTQYTGVRPQLHAADVAGLQALYGTRRPDRFDAAPGNNIPAHATAVRFVYDVDQYRGQDPTQTSPPWVVHADLTTASDVDYYRVQQPAGLNDFWVHLRTSGVSLLTSRVTVYDSAFRVVGTTQAVDPLQGNLALFVPNAQPHAVYYVRVEQSQPTAFGIGSYRLAVGKESNAALFPPVPSYLKDDRPDDDGGQDLGPLVPLMPRVDAVGPQWDYTHRASISYQYDVDRYRVVAPAATPSAMVVSVWQLESTRLEPKVTVFDTGPNPRPVAAQVLRNDRGFFTIQIANVTPGTAYEVRVEPADPQGSYKEGNYLVGVDFVSGPIALDAFAGGTLTQAARQRAHELQLTETRLFHFTLSADTGNAPVESAVRATIYNAQRQVVATFVAQAGETTSLSVLLAPGDYTIRIAARTRNSAEVLPPLVYNLRGVARNDPIGPTPVPPGQPPSPTFEWVDLFQLPGWIVAEDPYGDPYSGLN